MKKKLKEQVDAMSAFQSFCNEPENIIIWSHLTAFTDGLSKLDLKIGEIITTESEQEKDTKGVTHTKKEMKTLMANQTVAIAEGLQAYAVSVNDSEIFFSMSICFSKIMKAKNASALGASKLVYDTASELPKDKIEPFGISENVLNLLEQSIRNYAEAAPTTRGVITNKTVLTNKCAQLVKEGNEIMRKQLLKIGRQFAKTSSDFYEGLVANAKVISSSVHAKIRLTVESGDAGMVVPDAIIAISGTTLTGATDSKGKCTVSNVPVGERDVTVIKDDMSKTFKVKFQRGHSITMTVNISAGFVMPAVKETSKQKASVK